MVIMLIEAFPDGMAVQRIGKDHVLYTVDLEACVAIGGVGR